MTMAMSTDATAEPEGKGSDPLHILVFKKASNFTTLEAGVGLSPTNVSRFRPATEMRARLGLGFVDAIAAALQERIKAVAYNDEVSQARVTVVGSRDDNHLLSFTAAADKIAFGGFITSKGQATYHVAMLTLAYCLARRKTGPATDPAGEVAERWWMLVKQMEVLHPRSRPGVGWGSTEVKKAFTTPAVRMMVEQLTDSLEWATRLSHSTLSPREIEVRAAPVVEFDVALVRTFTAEDMLTVPTGIAGEPLPEPATVGGTAPKPAATTTAPAAMPAPAAPATPAATTTKAKAKAAPAPEAAPAPAPTPTPKARIFGPYVDRIRRNLHREGARVMLVGPTATGKTFQAMQCLLLMGWRIESVTLDPGKDALELVGGFTRRVKKSAEKDTPETWGQVWKQAVAWDLPTSLPEDNTLAQQAAQVAQSVIHALRAIVRVLYLLLGSLNAMLRLDKQDWEPVDGPIARWARQAAVGTPTGLILDELARGHQSCVSFVMGILNVYSRGEVEQQGLSVPAGFEDCPRFHVVDLWHTKERLVVPVTMVKIVATANLGDKYVGVDLADPAFRRRWDAWLHLSDYAPDVQRDIIADKLGLLKGSATIAAIQKVAAAVLAYQMKEEKLNATLDLATLLNWGATMQAYIATGTKVNTAFELAAVDTWLERIAPLKGADIDADVKAALTKMVKDNAPSTI